MLVLLLAACSAEIDCSNPSTVLVQGPDSLTCAEAAAPSVYLELLASRPLPKGDRQVVLESVRSAHRVDAVATRAWLASVQEAGSELEVLWGLKGAERRATRVWEAENGEGVIREEHAGVWTAQSRALSVWAQNESDRLAVTEADIEGWILYASLCREVQGGGVLRLSVADRVTVYRMVQERFAEAGRADRIALSGVGPYWSSVRDAWSMATYEQQQAWIASAPLPPPMTATSLGYMGALIDGDLDGLAGTLHTHLGPSH